MIKKKDKGGLNITNTVPLSHIDHGEIKAVMSEYRISSADVSIRCDATVDDLIDVLEAQNRRYIPVIYALNKIDSISIEELDLLYRIPNAVPISSEHVRIIISDDLLRNDFLRKLTNQQSLNRDGTLTNSLR